MKRLISLLMLCAVLLASCASPSSPTDNKDTSLTDEETTQTSDNNGGNIPEESAPTVVETTWNYGYVGSNLNTAFPNTINTAGQYYSYTDVIELGSKGTKVTFTDVVGASTSANAYVVSSWKKSGSDWVIDLAGANLIGGNESLVMSKTADGTVYTYVSTYDGECIRLCYRSGQTSATQTLLHPPIMMSVVGEKGTAAEMLENRNEGDYYSVLEGKTISFIGDSYFAGNGLDPTLVWPALLASKYNMNYKNYGINGSTISNYVTTNAPMVDRYVSMANNSPDIIIVDGGRNDFNQQVPIGEDGSLDTRTMKGATRYLFTKLREKYPNAVIIGVTMWDYYTAAEDQQKYNAGYIIACREYGEAFMKVCEDMGIPYINAMDKAAIGVDMTDAAFRAQYCMSVDDRSHLNYEGMKKVLPVFEKRIADIYTASKK